MRNRTGFLAVGACAAALAALWIWGGDGAIGARPEQVTLSELAEEIRAGNVVALEVAADRIEATTSAGRTLAANKEAEATLEGSLAMLGIGATTLKGVDVSVQAAGSGSMSSALGIVAVVGLLAFVLLGPSRRFPGLGAGRSRAKQASPAVERVRFDDVAGVEEAKEELAEVVEFLRSPERFRRLGARVPKGVLLAGPPGTGKTLLARAVAGEAGVPFFSTSGAEFVEMYVGVGASRARDLFRRAKANSPSIIFIDEIDAVGRHRGQANSHDEREQTLNQLLVEMDGFDQDANVVVIAATNRLDVLDAALLRPGRFDRRIHVERPDLSERQAILEVHTRGKPLAEDVSLHGLAKSIPGFAGADISNLVNEAAILTARRDKIQIGALEFMDAVERILGGPLKKHRVVSGHERRVIAVHEAGHAVVMHVLPECGGVQKVSVAARGRMGGYTMSVPEHETALYSPRRLMAELAGLLGGRAAEEIVIGEITTGASNDMERATGLAREMVMRYGMSARIGPIVYSPEATPDRHSYSETVATAIDQEVGRVVSEAYALARATLLRHRRALERVTEALLEHESLDAAAFHQAFRSGPAPAEALPAVEVSTPAQPAWREARPRAPRASWARLPRASVAATLMATATGLGMLASVLRRGTRRGALG